MTPEDNDAPEVASQPGRGTAENPKVVSITQRPAKSSPNYKHLQLMSSLELAEKARQREANGGPKYLWDGVIREGGLLGLLVAFSKAGKTTFAHCLYNAIARGDEFLGRSTSPTKILVIAVEDPAEVVEDNALYLLHGGHENILFHAAPLLSSDIVLDEIVETVKREGIGMVAVETLASFWVVADENDNSQVHREAARIRQAARKSGVPWLVHCHTGKKDNREDMGEIRGASSLAGAVDFSINLKREGRGETTKRKVYGRGRFGVLPAFIIDYSRDSHSFSLLEDDTEKTVAKVTKNKSATELRIEAGVGVDWNTTIEIAERVGMAGNKNRVKSVLEELDTIEKSGSGTKADPTRWRRKVSENGIREE